MTTFNTTAKLRTVATGKGTVNVSVEIARGDDGVEPNRIDEVFTDAELNVKLEIIPKDVQAEQQVLDGFKPLSFAGIARTNSYSVFRESFGFGMSFKKTVESEAELSHFAHKTVKLVATRTGKASDQAGEAGVGGESLYDETPTNLEDEAAAGTDFEAADAEDDEFGNDEGDASMSPDIDESADAMAANRASYDESGDGFESVPGT